MKILRSKIKKIIRDEISRYLSESSRRSSSVWTGDESVARFSEDGNSIFAIGDFAIAPATFGGTEATRRQAAKESALGYAARKIIALLDDNQRCITEYCIVHEGEEERERNGVLMMHVFVVVRVDLGDIVDRTCEDAGVDSAILKTCTPSTPMSDDTGELDLEREDEIFPSRNCSESMAVEIDGVNGTICISPLGNFIATIGNTEREYSLVGRSGVFSSRVSILSISRDANGVITLTGSSRYGDIEEELTDSIASQIRRSIESGSTSFQIESGGKSLTFNAV